jgi:hypothetical protein
MIWRDFDVAAQYEPARLHGRNGFFSGYSQFGRWPSWLAENCGLLAWPRVPIHDGKQPAGTQDIMNHARKTWLVWGAVERVCQKHVVNAVMHDLGNVVGISLNEDAVCEAAFGQPDARRIEQLAVNLDGGYRSRNLRQMQGEPAIPGT